MLNLISKLLTGIFVLSLVSCDSSDAFFVNAGVDQTVQIGTEVTLVGAAGSPDATITSYQWSQIAGVAVELTDGNTSTASFTAPMLTTDAVLTFRLVVNDDRGARVTDDVNIFVTVQPFAVPLDTSVIRAYQEDDTATGTMTFTDPTTGNTASGDVTLVVGAIVQNPFGIDCRTYTMSGTLTGPGGTEAFSVRQLLYQDTDNSVYECGEFNDTLGRYVFLTDTATTPNGVFLETKSPVQLGDTTSGVIYYDDGTWDDCTETVQSKENVSVPLGLYESYKIYQNCSYSDGTTLVSTMWLVPSIYFLKDISVVDGYNAELVLKSYSYK